MTYQPEVLTTTLTLEGLGGVDVSTSDLDYLGPEMFSMGCCPETCLFWGDDSHVVEHYPSWPEAVQGHVRWSDPATVAQAIVEYRRATAE